ncbi:MAG: glycosyltransferase family 9 protein [Cryomorphaceae bacterium]|nr:glycosyltransferase family 9 protein [Cryomorphaceae bacterium]
MARRILLIRLSALGDVAMLYPVVYRALHENPDVHITLLTRKAMVPIFSHLDRVDIFVPDLQNKHRGLFGLTRLYAKLKKKRFHAVVDVHNVLRSRTIGALFKLGGTKVVVLDKQRELRKKLTAKENKQRVELEPMVECYRQTFIKAGMQVSTIQAPPIFHFDGLRKGVGFAPFAGFTQKALPQEKIPMFVKALQSLDEEVYLFGAPGKERELLQSIAHETGAKLAVFSGGLREELKFMSGLRAVVSMDSANGHLAALVHCPVITIWGATHKDAGFTPLHTQVHVEISTDELTCRPCSVFGNKPCWRGDLACLHRIKAEDVVEAFKSIS